ncbi:MAG TPA: hypothetical protein VIN33_05165, partial [Marinobacter sp.]
MPYRWLTHLFRAGLISTVCSGLVVLPVAHAEQSGKSATPEAVVAELAEDESVEDVEHSEPLQQPEQEADDPIPVESLAEEKEEASSLEMLGAKVPPGTATRLSWSP